jgi:hypothetical protein
MVEFDSACVYVDGAKNLIEKIARLDAIISALETAALKAAAKGGISEYMLDDGQTKIREVYRSPVEIERSITAFEGIRQRYINRLNGSMIRLVDSKNFRGNIGGR